MKKINVLFHIFYYSNYHTLTQVMDYVHDATVNMQKPADENVTSTINLTIIIHATAINFKTT